MYMLVIVLQASMFGNCTPQCNLILLQDLYCVRSDLGNLLKALGRLDEAKVNTILFCAFWFSVMLTGFPHCCLCFELN